MKPKPTVTYHVNPECPDVLHEWDGERWTGRTLPNPEYEAVLVAVKREGWMTKEQARLAAFNRMSEMKTEMKKTSERAEQLEANRKSTMILEVEGAGTTGLSSLNPKLQNYDQWGPGRFELHTDRVAARFASGGSVWTMSMSSATNEAIPLDEVSSVSVTKDFAFWVVTVHSTGNIIKFRSGFEESVAVSLRDKILAARAAFKAAIPTDAPTLAPSMADELVKLAGLRDAGILTATEFEVAKARIIAS